MSVEIDRLVRGGDPIKMRIDRFDDELAALLRPLPYSHPEQLELIRRTHHRVAAYADGWQTAVCDWEDVAWRLADIRDQAAKLGRHLQVRGLV